MIKANKRANGSFITQFTLDGVRSTITLGKTSKRTADMMAGYVSELVEARQFNVMPRLEVIAWATGTESRIRKRLIDLKLIPERHSGQHPRDVDELIRYFKSVIPPGEESTQTFRGNTFRNLRTFFENRDLDSITPGCAEEFRRWLQTEANERISRADRQAGIRKGLAPCTVSRRCQLAREIFQRAADKRWIEENPFSQMKGWVKTNKERMHFIAEAPSQLILRNFHTFEHQLVFVLLRYQGLRAMEGAFLRWDWIDWDQGRMKVLDSKRKNFPGLKWRYPPIFPEVRPFLEQAWDMAAPGETWVVPYLRRKTSQAFTSALNKVLRKLGVEPWPRRLQNLRATRSTEVKRRFGADVEAAWIGHSTEVSSEAYQMVLESDYQKALQLAQHIAPEEVADDRRAAISTSGVVRTCPDKNPEN